MTGGPEISAAFAPVLMHLDTVLQGLRTGRANPGLVEHIEVESYGTKMRIKELATVTVPDARTIHIQPWDKGHVPIIAKTIESSPLGVMPAVAGTVIRLSLPPLTEERRRELTRLVRKHLEEARVAIRNIREKQLKELKSRKDAKELSEDALERERKKLQEDVDAAITAIDNRGKEKEKELLAF
ncbi:MAG: ribosome recycling factor [Parcubacteria group bacterium Gr01-1014_38]|nr:MAG: ribosome recycling factor [Parcubacteria group bacterium Gr01-1014_38]